MIRRVGAMGAMAVCVASCGAGAPTVRAAPLVTSRLGAPTRVPGIGALTFGVASEGRMTVFGARGVSVLVGGVVVGTDMHALGWTSVATVPAADGHGSWVVGIDDGGRVQRVHATGTVEDVSDRWGLTPADHVRAVAPFGDRGVAFALEHAVAVADGTSVVRYDIAGVTQLAGGAGRIAMVLGARVRVFTPAQNRWRDFALPDVQRVRIDDTGKLVLLTTHALYREDDGGELQRLYETASPLRDVIALSPGSLWFIADREVGEVSSTGIAISHGAAISPHAHWVDAAADGTRALSFVADGAWVHLARAEASSGTRGGAVAPREAPQDQWVRTVQPVFARACVPCHLPGGSADFDLSTVAAWQRARRDVRAQVLVARTMPPSGHALSEADRTAIGAWVGAASSAPSEAP